VTITAWELDPTFDAQTFSFAPSDGATQVDFLPR
jgi:outer membrane lipoprotein-sorting protein